MIRVAVKSDNDVLQREIINLIQQLEHHNYQLSDVSVCDCVVTTGLYEEQKKPVINLSNNTAPVSLQRLKDMINRAVLQTRHQQDKKFRIGDTLTVDRYDKILFLDGENVLSLTEKEIELLDILASDPDRAFSKEYLLESVWGYHEKTETHTVETHVYRLRDKTANVLSQDLIVTTNDGYQINPDWF
jgi:DNA-binding winged helix-turn-helix (wHTH) protein